MLARPLGVAPLVAGKLLRRPDQTLDECAIGAGDAHSPARLQHAPAFGEHAPAALVRHVLDHVLAKGAVKLGVGKGKGPCRVHPQDVMPARVEVGVDPAVERMVAAANVQFFHGAVSCLERLICAASSTVMSGRISSSPASLTSVAPGPMVRAIAFRSLSSPSAIKPVNGATEPSGCRTWARLSPRSPSGKP